MKITISKNDFEAALPVGTAAPKDATGMERDDAATSALCALAHGHCRRPREGENGGTQYDF